MQKVLKAMVLFLHNLSKMLLRESKNSAKIYQLNYTQFLIDGAARGGGGGCVINTRSVNFNLGWRGYWEWE